MMTTREEWLNELVNRLRPWYADAGRRCVAKVRVTCGWPSKNALGSKKRRIGECWNPECSKDNSTEVFISPCIETGVAVAAVLVHELVHAVGLKCGHRGKFIAIAKTLGLEGPWTAPKASAELVDRLRGTVQGVCSTPRWTS